MTRATAIRWRRAKIGCCLLAAMVGLQGAELPESNPSLTSLSIEQLLQVQVTTASLHSQSIDRAPANMTVVTAEEIRRFGYRTFGEVLSHVRGFYLTYDHTYREAGTGGFSVPGDWSTRVLVLVNGHNMTDNIFGSASYFDNDFAVDMSLVERIEIVRGTSSSLYGSNGILATINVITKKPGAPGSGMVSGMVRMEMSTPGLQKVTATGTVRLPRKASLLLSGSLFRGNGVQDIYFPEFDEPVTNNGHAIRMDGERGHRFFADLTAGNWEILAFSGTRVKIQPFSWGETIFNDRGTRAIDQHSVVEAAYTRRMDDAHELRWATSWDGVRFRGNYRYPSIEGALDGSAGITTNKEYDAGDWVTSKLTWRFPSLHGDLTAGGEGRFDLRALQYVADTAPVSVQRLNVNRLDKAAAGFLQQEWSLGTRWSVNVGARYDWSHYRSSAVSPRGAIIFQPDSRTTLKLVYGRGFRNPNANELFFEDGQQNAGNLALKPERADNLEASVFRNLRRSWKLGISAWRTVDRGIIVPLYNADGFSQFVNADRFHGVGLGGEISGKPFRFLEVDASFQQQKAHFADRATPANSPGSLGKFRFAVPLQGSRLLLSGGFLYQSERRSLAGIRLDPVWLPELTLVAKNLPKGVDVQFGVRNLSNTGYADPVGLLQRVDTLRQTGRTFFVTVTRAIGKG